MSPSVVRNKQALLSERAQRSLELKNLPFYYHVHLNMPCNQRCIMCVPNGQHRKDLLPFDRFLTFFEQIKPFAEHLTLIGGEPLLYPWIKEVLELLSHHPIAVTINTNATKLDETMARRLLSLHELYLKCSIDAVTRTTYRKIRGTDVFERVTAFLRRFAELAQDQPHIRLILVYVVMRENLPEVLPFIDFAKTLHPHRIEFHPVRHVRDWHVTNNTGWIFDGKEQSCESFSEEYKAVMRQAAAKCKQGGLTYEVILL